MKIIIFFFGTYFNYVFDKTPQSSQTGEKNIKSSSLRAMPYSNYTNN